MSDAKEYISKKQIPQLFECLMTGLMYHRPSDHIAYLQQCLDKIKVQGVSGVRWDLFLEAKRAKTPLPPVTPPRSAKRSASHTSSVSSELAEKKPVLPPIGGAATTAAGAAAPSAAVREAPSLSTSSNLPKLSAPLTCPLVLVMGGPGSGKRVICRYLAQRYGFASLCVGDLVRSGIRESRDASRQRWAVAAAAFERGDAVPEDLLLPALIEAVNDLLTAGRNTCRGVFVEGYPRSPEQADAIAEHLKQPDRALLLDFEEDLLQERLLRRYHRLGAIEDQPANIGRRIGHFRSAGLPACRLYDESRRLVVVAVDEDLDDAAVFDEAARAMDAFFQAVDTTARPQKQPVEGDKVEVTDANEDSDVASTAVSGVVHIEEIRDLPAPSKRPSDLPQCPIVLVMGGPGSGRSSQLRRVAQRYAGFVHINASEEARSRSLAAGPDAAWSALVDIATQGDLDEEVDATELRRLLIEKGRAANCILLEGYPINDSQLRDFYKTVGQPDLTVLLDCDEAYMVRRLLARGREKGGIGDNLGAVSKRMAYFKERTLPVVRHFDVSGKLCIVFGDRDDSEVFYDLAGLFDYVFFNQKPQHVQQDEARAAETIQAAFEGFITRQEFAEAHADQGGAANVEQTMDEQTAAETIQAAFESLKTREEFVAAQQGEPANKQDCTSEEQDAATKIQANFRGYQTRKNLAKK